MNHTLNIGLWAAQIFIALAFCWGGYMKIFALPKLASMWPWTADLRPTYVRTLGIVDIAGGAGLLIPAISGILPWLTVVAGLGCILLQLCAIIFHLSRREFSALPANFVFILASAFIVWGRWALLSI